MIFIDLLTAVWYWPPQSVYQPKDNLYADVVDKSATVIHQVWPRLNAEGGVSVINVWATKFYSLAL